MTTDDFESQHPREESGNGRFAGKSVPEAPGGWSAITVDDRIWSYNYGRTEKDPPEPDSVEQVYAFWTGCGKLMIDVRQSPSAARDLDAECVRLLTGRLPAPQRYPDDIQTFRACGRVGYMLMQVRELGPAEVERLMELEIHITPSKKRRIGDLVSAYDVEAIATEGASLVRRTRPGPELGRLRQDMNRAWNEDFRRRMSEETAARCRQEEIERDWAAANEDPKRWAFLPYRNPGDVGSLGPESDEGWNRMIYFSKEVLRRRDEEWAQENAERKARRRALWTGRNKV